MDVLQQLVHNQILMSTVIAWVLAQLIKVVLTLFFQRKLDLVRLFGSGGMPSSHSASVTCAATMAGLLNGFDSAIFGIATVIALVVMYDAAGVRRAAGKQAKLLNELIENYYAEHYINEKKLKELLGHTPVEVVAGSMLGIAIAIVYYY
jgi:acid phosphatase family membrane protein YuiD